MVFSSSFLSQNTIKNLHFFLQFLHLDRFSRHRNHYTSSFISADDLLSIPNTIPAAATSPAADEMSTSVPVPATEIPGDALLARLLKIFTNLNPSNSQCQPSRRSKYALKKLSDFQTRKVSDASELGVLDYMEAIKALIVLRRFDQAESKFNEMIDSGIAPNIYCVNVLVSMYSIHTKQFSWALGFIQWMSSLGVKPSVITYRILIKGLCRDKRIDHAHYIMEYMMKNDGLEPDIVCYNLLLDALVNAKMINAADSLFKEMVASSISPDVYACTTLIKGYLRHYKRFSFARKIVKWMDKLGLVPNLYTYSIMVNKLCSDGKVEDAFRVIQDEMLVNKCMPNCHTFAPILQAYRAKGNMEEAKKFLNFMESINCCPDTYCYNVYIDGLCKKGIFDEVENVLKESSSKGWDPDVVTYNSYINGLCKVGCLEEALRQLEVMLDKRIRPNIVTLNVFLDSLCTKLGIWKVKKLLERSFDLGLDFDAFSYNIVINRLCEVTDWSAVSKLFTDMLKKGIEPNTCSFNILIYSLCKYGKFETVKSIFYSKGFEPDIVSCNILMHQYVWSEKIYEVNELIYYMNENNIDPDTATYNIQVDSLRLKGKFSEAINFVKSINCIHSQETIAHLTRGLVKDGKIGHLLKLFEDLLDKGLVLDCQVYDFLITAFCKKGSCQSKEMYKISLILEKMLGH